ncbi:MAG: SprT-like domain-containing protein [Chitinophagales bacterium]|nr:SprT-like domain-containing protein [Chitinophagales bacterium]MDW8426950.1 SprT-like domain-containing protein [Chitinophagales bacterium]
MLTPLQPISHECHPLARYLPQEAVEVIARWQQQYRVRILVSRPLKHAWGMYYPPQGKRGHCIRINNNLNRYAFLITLVHEMAHLTAGLRYGPHIAPHGREWKQELRRLMEEFRGRRLFPRAITEAFRRHLERPLYSHCCDPVLMQALSRYDTHKGVFLNDLPPQARFRYEESSFQVLRRLKRRILCLSLTDRRHYVFEPYVVVCPLGISADNCST